MLCRHCAKPVTHTVIDLGSAPPSNAYLTNDMLQRPETYYPLRVKVCGNCWLVQTQDYASASELFGSDYAYFSSTSSSWLKHASDYVLMITRKLSLSRNSFVIEVASNDGYLLRNFVAAGIPCLGIEPTESTASAAELLSIKVVRKFFGLTLAEELVASGRQADLLVANNVLAHVPDINDFLQGVSRVLKPEGIATFEFPAVNELIENCYFDSIYHEHYSYLSLFSVERMTSAVGLRVFDVEKISTHGGSLRVYICRQQNPRPVSHSCRVMQEEEMRKGINTLEFYTSLQARADRIKYELLKFLIDVKQSGKRVAAYGAAAKGNTILNYAGIKPDLLPFVGDAAASKQGKYLPGSHIPIVTPRIVSDYSPDYILVLPWNILPEIMECLSNLKSRGTKFVTAVPELRVL